MQQKEKKNKEQTKSPATNWGVPIEWGALASLDWEVPIEWDKFTPIEWGSIDISEPIHSPTQKEWDEAIVEGLAKLNERKHKRLKRQTNTN